MELGKLIQRKPPQTMWKVMVNDVWKVLGKWEMINLREIFQMQDALIKLTLPDVMARTVWKLR